MFDRLMGRFLLGTGRLSKEQLDQIYEIQDQKRARLGVIAVSEKLMTVAQAEEINSLQATRDKRFGDLAIGAGYLSENQVQRLLEMQGNPYLVFTQTVIDSGALTMDELGEAMQEFQDVNGFMESDIEALKADDVSRIVPMFLGPIANDPQMADFRNLFSIGVKNVYRLVDSHVYIGKATLVQEIPCDILGYQKFHGAGDGFTAITGHEEDLRRMTIAYTKEEFIETNEDALDATCEFINCVNGLFATEESMRGRMFELEPPVYELNRCVVRGDQLLSLPVYCCGGEMNLIISLGGNTTVNPMK